MEEKKIKIPDDGDLFFQELNMKLDKFNTNLSVRVDDFNSLNFILKDQILFKNKSGDVFSADWDFLSIYKYEKEEYFWNWCWNIIKHENTEKIKLYLKKIDENVSFLSRNYLVFEDSLILKYLIAFLCYIGEYEYMFATKNLKGEYVLYGFKNIKWLKEPDDDLISKFNENKKEMFDKTNINEKIDLNFDNILEELFSSEKIESVEPDL